VYFTAPNPFPALEAFVIQSASAYAMDLYRFGGGMKAALGEYLACRGGKEISAILLGTRTGDPNGGELGWLVVAWRGVEWSGGGVGGLDARAFHAAGVVLTQLLGLDAAPVMSNSDRTADARTLALVRRPNAQDCDRTPMPPPPCLLVPCFFLPSSPPTCTQPSLVLLHLHPTDTQTSPSWPQPTPRGPKSCASTPSWTGRTPRSGTFCASST
jgi:hypothetical protein